MKRIKAHAVILLLALCLASTALAASAIDSLSASTVPLLERLQQGLGSNGSSLSKVTFASATANIAPVPEVRPAALSPKAAPPRPAPEADLLRRLRAASGVRPALLQYIEQYQQQSKRPATTTRVEETPAIADPKATSVDKVKGFFELLRGRLDKKIRKGMRDQALDKILSSRAQAPMATYQGL